MMSLDKVGLSIVFGLCRGYGDRVLGGYIMKKWILSIVFVLIVGIGVGIAVDAHVQQNRIAFINATTAMAKSINVLNHEPNVDMTGFASDPNKQLISVAFAVKKVPVTKRELNSIMDGYLSSARGFDSSSRSNFIQPYQLDVTVYKYALSADHQYLLYSGTKRPWSNQIVWTKTT